MDRCPRRGRKRRQEPSASSKRLAGIELRTRQYFTMSLRHGAYAPICPSWLTDVTWLTTLSRLWDRDWPRLMTQRADAVDEPSRLSLRSPTVHWMEGTRRAQARSSMSC